MASVANKWNSDETLLFLEIYEQHECLWNIRHPEYTNKSMRDFVIKRLLNMLIEHDIQVENVDFLRKKIKSLKNVYRQEAVKIEKSKRSGGLVYRPKLSWFAKADSFLRDVVRCSPSSANLEAVENFQEESEEAHVLQPAKRALTLKRISPLRKRPKVQITNVNSAINRLHNLANSRKEEDEFACFGNHVASQLRQLPIRSSLMLQERIQSMITRERLFHMEGESPPTNFSEIAEENNTTPPTVPESVQFAAEAGDDSNYEYVCKLEEEEEKVDLGSAIF